MILLLLVISFISSANTDPLALEFQKTKIQLVEKEIQQRRVLSSLYQINKDIQKLITDKRRVNDEFTLLNTSTKDLAKSILDLEQQREQKKYVIRKRLIATHRFSKDGILKLLFSTSSGDQLNRNLKILGIISKHDIQMVHRYSELANNLKNKKQRFSGRIEKIKQLKSNYQKQELALQTENQRKKRILNQLRSDKSKTSTYLTELRKKDDHGVLDSLFLPSFFEKKGSLLPPISGAITQKYGMIHDANYGLTMHHKGVYFSSERPLPVRSVFTGKVAYIGALPGIGTTIILDHGDHYYSVYGGVTPEALAIQQEVKQGQILATTGKTDHYVSSGVYFEIRHFSEPENPSLWMKGTTL